MRRARLATAALGAVVAVALVAGACGEPPVPIARSSDPDALVTATPVPLDPTPTPTATPEPTPTPDAGALVEPTPLPLEQPGLTAETLRVAVITDEKTGGVADDLFRDATAGTMAWALSVNARGGLGGRLIEVVPIDARLFNHRAVLEVICDGEYFAIVGSQSLGDYEGAELLGTEACDLADFPGEVYGARRAESPNTFLANPMLNQTRQSGPARWLIEEFPEASQNVVLFYFDELQLRNETERLREMLVGEGMTVSVIDTDFDEGASERVLTRWQEFEAEGLVWNADPDRLIALLREFEDNDLEPAFVLCELGCYSERFIRQGGSAVEGVYAWIPHRPFDSPAAPGEMIDFRYYLNQALPGEGWSEVALKSYIAGLLFEEAFAELQQREPEAPTRRQLVDIARQITAFDADGILPFTDPGPVDPTPCFALMTVRGGRWVQAHPTPTRDLDCSPDNLYTLVATRVLGLETTTDSSATNSDIVDSVEEAEEEADLEHPEDIPD